MHCSISLLSIGAASDFGILRDLRTSPLQILRGHLSFGGVKCYTQIFSYIGFCPPNTHTLKDQLYIQMYEHKLDYRKKTEVTHYCLYQK